MLDTLRPWMKQNTALHIALLVAFSLAVKVKYSGARFSGFNTGYMPKPWFSHETGLGLSGEVSAVAKVKFPLAQSGTQSRVHTLIFSGI